MSMGEVPGNYRPGIQVDIDIAVGEAVPGAAYRSPRDFGICLPETEQATHKLLVGGSNPPVATNPSGLNNRAVFSQFPRLSGFLLTYPVRCK
jgi:hypothetical protein